VENVKYRPHMDAVDRFTTAVLQGAAVGEERPLASAGLICLHVGGLSRNKSLGGLGCFDVGCCTGNRESSFLIVSCQGVRRERGTD
jgi:hypothetical protein